MLEFRLVEDLELVDLAGTRGGAHRLTMPPPKTAVLKSELRAELKVQGPCLLRWNPTMVWLCNKLMAVAGVAIFACPI